MEELMEQVGFSLEQKVDFGGVGLTLDATIDNITEGLMLEKWWGKILFWKVA